MHQPGPLLGTKLRRPVPRAGLVARPRLQETIAQGLRGPLTLVTAPAGFGKTTLVAACLAGWEGPVAWLSLDKNDNQVGRFLSYLVAALQAADPAIGGEAAQRLGAGGQAPPETVLASLLNDLDRPGRELVLALDDYQFINNPAVHEQVVFLLEHAPESLHLVIATRSDPPLPVARLRARGRLVELRAAELSFSEPEAAQFLNEVMGLGLDAASVTALAERTEGWIAGLQMASIALQGLLAADSQAGTQDMAAPRSSFSGRERQDVPGFIAGFSGTNRYILDYLLEEVLASQPPEIQRFLLVTSILERLTAPLCAAILGDGDKERRLGKGIGEFSGSLSPIPLSPQSHCQTILEDLEHANLFLVPLDDERQWYRYHHLFADLLRAQLQKTGGDPVVASLHRRAAAWHEGNGLILEAIHHASMAADDEEVERLIKQHYLEMMNRGELSWVRFWMGSLSKELVHRRPWLCLYEAMNNSWFGQLEEADALLEIAEKHIRSAAPGPEALAMQGYHDYVKSRVSAMQGDTRRAIEFCRAALENVPADSLDLQIDFRITLGYEYFLSGDFASARRTLDEMIHSASSAGAVNNPVAADCLLARAQVSEGRLPVAETIYRRAARLIQEAGGGYLGVDGLVEVGIAALACERNELAAARSHLERGLELLPSWGKTDDLCLAYATLARILLALGNRAGAAGAVEKAVELVRTCGVFSEARGAVEAAQVRMWLAQGDRPEIDRWLASLKKRFPAPDPFLYEDEPAHLTQVRVLLAQDKPAEALPVLSGLESSARAEGRQGRLVEILVLKALALQGKGDRAQAEVALTESLALAESGGFVRVFLDEGQAMRPLLARWLAHAGAGPLRDYALNLFAQFEAEAPLEPAAPEESSPATDFVEPLTPRELDVLALLAQGSSNRQIAAQLVLAEGTVKYYVHAIMEKLGVHSRTQAVLVARERKLV